MNTLAEYSHLIDGYVSLVSNLIIRGVARTHIHITHRYIHTHIHHTHPHRNTEVKLVNCSALSSIKLAGDSKNKY